MIFRTQISFPTDTALPRDEISITPHFFGDNAGALANALKANLIANAQIGVKPFKVKVYDATKAPPNYPLAVAEQTGTPPASGVPREVCLCLSYYSTWNRPRFRGRLYMPEAVFGGAQSTRPNSAQMQAVLDFAEVFTTNLPAAHNWVVYSRMTKESNGVSDIWCDDEWDIQRSRGLRGTTRLTASV